MTTYLAARFVPPVGRRARRLLAGVLLFEVGTGMTLPLVIVYLHDARGLGLGDAGLALAAVGAGGLVATIAAGVLVDRVGAGWSLLLVTAGYSQFTSAFPAWTTGVAGAPSSLVGFAFAANTWTIGLAQLPVLSLVRGRRRTRAIAGTGLLFAACWLLVLGAGETSVKAASYAGLVAAAAVFGLGETLLSPSLPAIVNDLADEDARGRYVAVYSLSWQAGPMIGPAIAGAALAAGDGAPLLLGLTLACALAAPAAIAFERLLPPGANGTQSPA
jgi:MFS family permease